MKGTKRAADARCRGRARAGQPADDQLLRSGAPRGSASQHEPGVDHAGHGEADPERQDLGDQRQPEEARPAPSRRSSRARPITAVARRCGSVIIVVWPPSRRPLKPIRSRRSCSQVMTTLAATVPITRPGDPERLVQRDGHDDVDDHVDRRQLGRDPRALEREERPAEQQVDAGEGQAEGEPEQRLRDIVRGQRRRTSRAGRPGARSAWRAPPSARPTGSACRLIWRIPLPSVRRIPPASRADAIRLSVGNRTVATATLKIPWGSM